MFLHLWIAVAIAVLFYLAIPLAGAVRARRKWKAVRDRVVEAPFATRLEYRDYAGREGVAGEFRFFGKVDAFEGPNLVWLSDARQEVKVELAPGDEVAFLDYRADDDEGPSMRMLRWKDVGFLDSGAKAFVCGAAFAEAGVLTFSARAGSADLDAPSALPPLVVFHEIDEFAFFDVAVRAARHPNEYWNETTRASLVAGFAASSLGLFFGFNSGMLPTVAMLSLEVGCIPLMPLLPPGLVLFMAYRVVWKRAREWRAERDALEAAWRRFERGKSERRFARLPSGARVEALVADGREPVAWARNVPVDSLPDGIPAFPSVEPDPGAPRSLFGAFEDRGGDRAAILRPSDPLAPCFSLDGEPSERVAKAAIQAGVYARVAAGLLAIGILVNSAIVFALFRVAAP